MDILDLIREFDMETLEDYLERSERGQEEKRKKPIVIPSIEG